MTCGLLPPGALSPLSLPLSYPLPHPHPHPLSHPHPLPRLSLTHRWTISCWSAFWRSRSSPTQTPRARQSCPSWSPHHDSGETARDRGRQRGDSARQRGDRTSQLGTAGRQRETGETAGRQRDTGKTVRDMRDSARQLGKAFPSTSWRACR